MGVEYTLESGNTYNESQFSSALYLMIQGH